MRRIGIAATLMVGALAFGPLAKASGDMGCEVNVRPAATSFSDCNSSALLVPGNDTRVNLSLLIFDRHGASPRIGVPAADRVPTVLVPFGWTEFAYPQLPADAEAESDSTLAAFGDGEGTICVSNKGGQADFVAAVQNERKLSHEERTYLVATRKTLGCNGTATEPDAIVTDDTGTVVQSDAGGQFLAYLRATERFYAGDYRADDFIALSKSKQTWVREAALYMVGRAWALAAQAQGFGTYGDIEHDKMDRAALAKAEAGFKAYLKAYPQGEYAASAYGLLRRTYWLGGDSERLAEAYGWQIDQRNAALRNLDETDLAAEIDAKLPLEAYAGKDAHPVLLAVDDLRQMRVDQKNFDTSEVRPVLSRQALEAQRPRFAKDLALFEYLLAVHAYFVERQPARVLNLLPATTGNKPMDYLAFSRAMLRALAMDATGDAGARAALVALFAQAKQPYQRQTLEIALAMHDERHGALAQVFASDSLIADPALREILLRNVAGAELLRAQATVANRSSHERAVALFTLLYKELTRGQYADFIADSKLIPADPSAATASYGKLGERPALQDFDWAGTSDGYACPALRAIAATLARTPKATQAELCLAEFVRLNGYDHFVLDAQPPADELGGTPSLFPGKPYSRQTTYQRVIADPAAAAEDKAYALYRAVQCYAPSGANDCGGEEVPTAIRKAWFNQLKSRYPASPWAKSLRYYW